MRVLFYLLVFLTVNLMTLEAQNEKWKQSPFSSLDSKRFYEKIIHYNDSILRVERFYLETADSSKSKMVMKYFIDAENRKQGRYISFDFDGDKNTIGNYKNNVKHGQWQYYVPKYDQKLNLIGLESFYMFYKDGKIVEKEIKKAFKEEKIKVKTLKHGLQKEWYTNGTLKLEGNYKNNYKDGIFRKWYENGQIKELATYRRDTLIGEGKWYHENGQMSSHEKYDNEGNLISIKQWNDEGSLRKGKLAPLEGTLADKGSYHVRLYNYINRKFNKNILKNYPLSNSKVICTFIVDKDGKINNVQTQANGVPSIFLEEIKKLLQSYKGLEPSRYHNLPVKVNYTLPITIRK